MITQNNGGLKLKTHLLLEKAYVYPIKEEEINLEEYNFNTIKGYWVNKKSFQPLILDSSVQKPRSKKCDRETGEDQKGE